MFESTSADFKKNAKQALSDTQLQSALNHVRSNFVGKRAKAVDAVGNFDAMRNHAQQIKDHVLENLDVYLQTFEENVQRQGGEVLWAATAADARGHVLDICRKYNAKRVTKGKSMISEEIELNDFLINNAVEPVETDLGEYLIQLRGEHPSHIIAPAVHLKMDQVRHDFRTAHTHLDPERSMSEPEDLLKEARGVLRDKFLSADVGITGANFLVAETGSSVVVTNEGNGDLTQTLPRVHIVLASIEKVVPNLEDMAQIIRVLARSATGQETSVYTTISTGPKRDQDPDGPQAYYVILLDNGRSSVLGGEFSEMLRCIRCGACMNHCPVYQAVGGHAYGWVYPGPMGSVLTPMLNGLKGSTPLPNASTFCGRCEAVCPMNIPLPKMLRNWRNQEFSHRLTPTVQRGNLKLWAWLAQRPALYRFVFGWGVRILALMGWYKRRLRRLVFARGWTKFRDLPAPEGETFLHAYQRERRRNRP